MEHRLILGGEQWLPFARSCVTKLKKLGLPYASQSFEIDGASIRVRIEPGHEYIRIEGGGSIAMDSGVVDMGGVVGDPYSVTRLYGTSYSDAYRAVFTAPFKVSNPFTKVDEWFLKPPTQTPPTYSGQLAGSVRLAPSPFGAVIGLTPTDREPSSFRRNFVESTDVDGVTSWVDTPLPDSLFLKKYVAFKVPASCFSGKCRLYVQSLYGSPLYVIEAGKQVLNLPYELTSSDLPFLQVEAYREDKKAPVIYVLLTNSTGVHLDSHGQHWLITFAGNGNDISAYPLRSTSKQASKLRTLLKSAKIDAADKERIEAYLLSTSLPDIAGMKKTSFAEFALPSQVSLGYGWHWNWSGTAADIVTIDALIRLEGTPNQHYVNRSKLDRIEFSVTYVEDKPDINVALKSIIPKTEWNAPRPAIVILAPDWAANGYTKINLPVAATKDVVVETNDAPVYVYYSKDELMLTTVSITLSDPPPITITSGTVGPPMYGGGYIAGWQSYQTFGLDGGWVRGSTGTHTEPVRNAAFKLNGASVGTPAYLDRLVTEDWTWDMTSKWEIDHAVPPATSCTVAADITISNQIVSTASQMMMLVPRNDCEAVFFHSARVVNSDITAEQTKTCSSYSLLSWQDTGGGSYQHFYATNASPTNDISGTTYHNSRTTTAASTGQVMMVGKTAVPGFSFEIPSEAFSESSPGMSSVSVEVMSSATSQGERAVICKGRASFGLSNVPTFPAFVGWA